MSIHSTSRSSYPEVFCKNDVLRNFAKFTGKHLHQSLFFNKVVGLRPATLLKKRLAQYFPINFTKILRTPFLIEHLRLLLPYPEGQIQVQKPIQAVTTNPNPNHNYIVEQYYQHKYSVNKYYQAVPECLQQCSRKRVLICL